MPHLTRYSIKTGEKSAFTLDVIYIYIGEKIASPYLLRQITSNFKFAGL